MWLELNLAMLMQMVIYVIFIFGVAGEKYLCSYV
jgi:hypothetical protein